ncbi:MAG: hypothetical protein WD070_01475, partial [Pirellulaceae bacterium]
MMASRLSTFRLKILLAAVAVSAASLAAWRRIDEHDATFDVLAKAEHVSPALAEPTWLDRITHANLKRVT